VTPRSRVGLRNTCYTDVQRAPVRDKFPRCRIGLFPLGSNGLPMWCKNKKSQTEATRRPVAVCCAASPPAAFRLSICARSSPLHRGAPSHVRAGICYSTSSDGFGYAAHEQGSDDNTRGHDGGPATACLCSEAPLRFRPRTPGADATGRAIAVCLECARLLKLATSARTTIVFCNREETASWAVPEFVASLCEPSA